MIVKRAKKNAHPIMSKYAQWISWNQGLRTIKLPMNPTRTADQRRMPTFSPNRGMDRATTKNGEINIIEFASAKPI